ncbi:MAG: Rrf2 family transcriptional regulator [Phycisphaerales bacterium]|nr:Rrf2 family transcriptional regulator [Phycisphaerales bacterium]
MLSTTSEYALRIMVTLASSQDAAMTSDQVARATQVPADYAVKVLQALARANLVKAQRGRGGGFRITCDPATTSLLDVVNAIDESLSGDEMRPLEAPAAPVATLRQRLVEVMGQARAALRKTSLIDMAEANVAIGLNGRATPNPLASAG